MAHVVRSRFKDIDIFDLTSKSSRPNQTINKLTMEIEKQSLVESGNRGNDVV